MNLGRKTTDGAVAEAEPEAEPDLPALGRFPINETLEVPVSELKVNPWNPRSITESGMESLKVSITQDRDGLWDRPCIALLDGTVIAGNHRLLAAIELEWASIPTRFKDYGEEQAKLVALRDNNSWALWDDHAVGVMLIELQSAGVDIDNLSGFADEQLAELIKLGAPIEDPEPGSDPRGESLALSDVSVGDPNHQVAKGDVWHLGPHVLVCAGLYEGWPQWAPLLTEGKLFVPYPTPTLPLTERADQNPLVLVQPDRWLAGHVLDKYAAVRGDDTVVKQA